MAWTRSVSLCFALLLLFLFFSAAFSTTLRTRPRTHSRTCIVSVCVYKKRTQMAMALPVIATLWSGPSQYMNPSNSYPLAHDGLEEIEEGAFKGHRWAKPSVVHLRALMRRVVEHPVEAKAIGEQARRDMVEKYSPEHLNGVLLQHFARITNKYLAKMKS